MTGLVVWSAMLVVLTAAPIRPHESGSQASPGAQPGVATARQVVEKGSIVESRFDDGAGLAVRRYNAQHDVVSETLFADSSSPVTFRYALHSSNASTAAAMSCTGPSGPVTRNVRVTVGDREAQARAIRANCIRRR